MLAPIERSPGGERRDSSRDNTRLDTPRAPTGAPPYALDRIEQVPQTASAELDRAPARARARGATMSGPRCRYAGSPSASRTSRTRARAERDCDRAAVTGCVDHARASYCSDAPSSAGASPSNANRSSRMATQHRGAAMGPGPTRPGGGAIAPATGWRRRDGRRSQTGDVRGRPGTAGGACPPTTLCPHRAPGRSRRWPTCRAGRRCWSRR